MTLEILESQVDDAEKSSHPPASNYDRGKVALSVEGLSVFYGKNQEPAVDDVSLTLHENDSALIFGASGSGKTSLLRALEGSIKPKTGSVERSGSVAMVYQDLRLIGEKSVLYNVCCGCLAKRNHFAGVWGFADHTKDHARTIMRELGLSELENQKVSRLSGGQQQRVAVARALMSDPKVILADEPVAALDCCNAMRVIRLLLELQKKHSFALLVSIHDSRVAHLGFNRALQMSEGTVKDVSVKNVLKLMNEEEDDSKESDQDRVLLFKENWFEKHLGLLLTMFLVTMALWSSYALNVGSTELSGAVSGVMSFVQSVVPDSRAELVNLPWRRLALSLIETAQMAFLGTLIGIVISLPLAALASRTTAPRPVRSIIRLLLNGMRTIPALFWGLIFVAAVGLGPISGTLALAAYSIGYLAKFFYEALESLDQRPMQAIRTLGATRIQAFFVAVLPAVRPYLISSCLFMLEYNIRSASILGIVGAGGIGQDLMYFFEWRQFPQAAAGLFLILLVVVVLDTISDKWRHRLVKARSH